jgi:long-subunit acyl-CoA synthetase (AMP-forming)
MLLQQLKQIANQQPDRIALQGQNSTYTWFEMIAAVELLAEQLQSWSGHTIALYADNSPEWIIADLAAQQAAVTLLPLPSFFSQQQIEHALSQSAASAVIVDDLYQFRNIIHCEHEALEKLAFAPLSLCRLQPESEAQSQMPATTAKITFTSGSTGQPKGVCLSNEQQYRVASSLCAATQLFMPIHLCVLPLSTLLENIAGVYTPLLAGGTVVVLPLQQLGFNGASGFDIQRFLACLDQQQPHSMILLPELLMALLAAVQQGWQAPLTLSFIAVGGSKVSPQLLNAAHAANLPVYEGYGLSECSSVVSLNTPTHNKPGSAGKILDHLQVHSRDGELIVSGNAFLGYLNQPDSWNQTEIHTGDLGEVDEQGYVFINGRKKNLLISSYGRNISPEWVESELLAGPLLQQCVVFGDAQAYCIAVLVSRDASTSDAQIQQWIDQVNLKLPVYAHIQRWLKLAEPMSKQQGLITANGRPVRHAIFANFEPAITALYEDLNYAVL